ncbi:hypothetical protein BGZ74_002664 [Mortierella antarctica]|nr:hypothetical protein BGZ74_002664 [Mortierella antarctica]
MSYRSRDKNFKPIVTNASHAYAPSAIQYATLEGVANFFQDPPDADSLIRRKRHQGLFSSMIKDTHNESNSESENDCRPMRNRTFRVEYHGLRFDLSTSNQWSEANRSRILLAALYLKDRFQLLVCHLRGLHRANLTVSSRNLQALVADLKHEQMLKDATVEACLTLYFQLVNARRCMDAYLAEPTDFKPTHLFKIAGYLVGYDDEIQKAKDSHLAAMDGSNRNKVNKPLQILDAMGKEDGLENEQSLYTNLVTGASPQVNTRSSTSSPTRSLPSTPTSSQSASSAATTPERTERFVHSHEKMEQEMLRMHTQMADLLATVKTQQLMIETLQGRVNTLESDLPMSKEEPRTTAAEVHSPPRDEEIGGMSVV